MSRSGPPEGYIEVPDRIRAFKVAYPDGSLRGDKPWIERFKVETEAGLVERTFIVYRAYAYRTPDDPRPAVGTAWETFPGKTPYTRDSELMNAETSAWGRALAALGFVGKSVATAEEVQARQAPPPLMDERAQELKGQMRKLYEQIRLVSSTALPPGRFDLMLRQREHEHKALEEGVESLKSMLEHLKSATATKAKKAA